MNCKFYCRTNTLNTGYVVKKMYVFKKWHPWWYPIVGEKNIEECIPNFGVIEMI